MSLALLRDLTTAVSLFLPICALASSAISGRGGLGMEDSSSSVLLIVQGVLSLGIATFLHIARNTPIGWLFKIAGPLTLIVLLALASVVWSDYPDLTFRRGTRFAMECATFIMLGMLYDDPAQLLRLLLKIFVAVLGLDVVMYVFPSISMTKTVWTDIVIGYAGVHGHKNSAGQFFFMAMPLFIVSIFRREICSRFAYGLGIFIVSVVIMVTTHSKTSFVLTPAVAALSLYLSRHKNIPPAAHAFIVAVLVVCLALVVVSLVAIGVEPTIAFLTGDPTVTGRAEIWGFMLFKVDQAPLLGHGYGAIWMAGPASMQQQVALGLTWLPNQAHEGYLDVLAQLGWIGFVCVSVFILRNIIITSRLSAREQSELAYRLLFLYASYLNIGAVLYNLSESSLMRVGHVQWITLLFLTSAAVNVAIRHNLRRGMADPALKWAHQV